MKHLSPLTRLAALAAVAAAFALPMAAHAESSFKTGTGALTATAKLDFEISVEKFVFLQVGTGTSAPMADNTTVDKQTFSVTATNNGSGTTVSGGSAVAVTVKGNAGDLTLANNGSGNFSGGTSTIALSTVSPTVVGSVPHAAWGSSSSLTATGGVVNATSNWSFSYSNAAVVAAGTYTKQVTYTLTSL